ncbi:hypothetical protein [Flagellimonas oceanensis]|uniref:hypothetical protein n=1 Tax=Flagellimonas oceanensis TaxID=2499163 RepID=UPI00197B7FF5|nr:hypothetical protein [Allomuricauda oceanensis]
MTLENLIADGFDKLEKYVTNEKSKSTFSINPKVTLEYQDIKGSFSIIDFSKEKVKAKNQILPPQLTVSKLGEFFGESNCCWVLEDFHKIEGDEKTRVSQIMKIFMDMSHDYPDLKIIAIGAVGTAREVVQYDHEMNNRISEIHIPPMEPDEIKSIIKSGEKLLNIYFSEEDKNKIAEYSCGIPAICHQLCLNMCFSNQIFQTVKKRSSFEPDELDIAIEKFISERSDSLKAEYDLAIKSSRLMKTNDVKIILKAALSTNQNEFNIDQIQAQLKTKVSEDVLTKRLHELSSVKRGEILIFSESSGNYRFNNLFIKNYALMNLSRRGDEQELIVLKEQKSIDRLLEIIHQDLSEEFDKIHFEDLD